MNIERKIDYARKNVARIAGIGLVAIGSIALPGCGKELKIVDSTPATSTPVSTPVGSERLAVFTATPKPEATARPEVTVEPTAVEKSTASKMELPKPAAWDRVPSVNLVQATSIPTFPKTAAEAAATFGVDGSTRDPKRWEKTAEGEGWHLSEATKVDDTKDALDVNFCGMLGEGYYDIERGRNPFAFVVVGIDGKIPVQGATFWNEKRIDQADKLQAEMAIPKWRDDSGNVTTHPVTKIVPNQGQKAEAILTAPAEYPKTADKAASLFGGKSENWELNTDGGWHLKPQANGVEIFVSPSGRIMEGYNTEGVFVAGGKNNIKVLGGTVWNESGQEALKKLQDAVSKNTGKSVKVIE